MTALRKAVLSLLTFLIASASLLMAQGTYTKIDFPGASYTSIRAINNAGDIVGYYEDTQSRGFLLSGGVFTSLNPPGSLSTLATGINDAGQVVGYTDLSDGYVSFLYDIATQTYTLFSYSADTETFANAINNAGTIVGGIATNHLATSRAFELNGTTYTFVRPPGADSSMILSINNAGDEVLAGYALDNDSWSYYLRDSGGLKQLGYFTQGKGVEVAGVNDLGAVVGADTKVHSDYLSGFVQPVSGGPRRHFRFPGALGTQATGVNSAGVVVGYYYRGLDHGFSWTPPSDPVK